MEMAGRCGATCEAPAAHMLELYSAQCTVYSLHVCVDPLRMLGSCHAVAESLFLYYCAYACVRFVWLHACVRARLLCMRDCICAQMCVHVSGSCVYIRGLK